jgi:dolichol-phosphate mannosyltransferase
MARGNILTVLDADLQHPPEILPRMLAKIQAGHDLVIPSRYVPGGDDGGLSLIRKIISQGARLLAWLALKNARCTTDPLSGYFMFRKSIIKVDDLKPVGWKILLEILVKSDFRSIADVPYCFQTRVEEKSKMSLREQWNFLCHLGRLVAASPQDSRFWKFCLVGLSGVFVNLTIYAILVSTCHINVVLAGVFAAFITMFSNFMLNDQYTWKKENNQSFATRLVKFYIFCSIGIFLNAGVLTVFYQYTDLNYLLANFLGIFAASIWNFTANNKWTWTNSKAYELAPEDES